MMADASARSTRDTLFDQLRGIAVLWVIGGHAAVVVLRPSGLFGKLVDPIHAVGLFFAVSGYLVAGSIERAFGERGLWGLLVFVVRRWLRLALPHAGAFLIFSLPAVAALVSTINWNIYTTDGPTDVARVLGLFSAWTPIVNAEGSREIAISSVVIGNWSISVEWFAALFLLPYVTLRLPKVRALALLTALTAIGIALSLSGGGGSNHFPLSHLSSFLVGVWAYRSATKRVDYVSVALLGTASLVALLVGMSTSDQGFLAAFEPVWGLLIVGAFHLGALGGRGGRLLSWFGARSYGAYLFHMIGVSGAFALLSAEISGWALWAACLALGLVVAAAGGALTAWLLEGPSISLGRLLARRLLR
jgi:peptidoglycan/LPS O-acetylase OafA/YrhL